MSKDFEQAYRELAEREIPDLWDRIEAGLESKSTPEDGKEKIEDVRNDIRDDIEAGEVSSRKPEKKKGKRFPVSRYSKMAAAAVCVAVVLPAAVFLFRTGAGGLGYESASGTEGIEDIDMAAAASGETGFAEAGAADAPEDAAEEEMDAGGMAETWDESAEPDEDKALDEKRDTSKRKDEMNVDTGAGSPLQDQSDSLSSQKQGAAMVESLEECIDELSAEAAEETVIEHVEIRVTEEENDFEKADGSFAGTFYTVTVQKDASGGLKEGQELVVELPAYYSFVLAKDSVYEVDLICQEDGTYVLEGYHRQIGE